MESVCIGANYGILLAVRQTRASAMSPLIPRTADLITVRTRWSSADPDATSETQVDDDDNNNNNNNNLDNPSSLLLRFLALEAIDAARLSFRQLYLHVTDTMRPQIRITHVVISAPSISVDSCCDMGRSLPTWLKLMTVD